MMSHVVTTVEALGVLVLVVGAVLAFATSARSALRRSPNEHHDTYEDLRRGLARVILLGLEVLILADIIHTVVVDQTPQSVAVLGIIVTVRIVLSWSLMVEIEGVWPWQRWRISPGVDEPSPRRSGSH